MLPVGYVAPVLVLSALGGGVGAQPAGEQAGPAQTRYDAFGAGKAVKLVIRESCGLEHAEWARDERTNIGIALAYWERQYGQGEVSEEQIERLRGLTTTMEAGLAADPGSLHEEDVPELGLHEVVTALLAPTGIEVLKEARAGDPRGIDSHGHFAEPDAELALTVVARPLGAVYAPRFGRGIPGVRRSGLEAHVYVALTMPGLPKLEAAAHGKMEPPEEIPSSTGTPWYLVHDVVRTSVLRLLSRTGPEALRAFLLGTDEHPREMAISVLCESPTPAAIPLIVEALGHPGVPLEERGPLLRALAGLDAAAAEPYLVEGLQEWSLSPICAELLGGLPSAVEARLPLLLEMANDTERAYTIRENIITVLRAAAPVSTAALHALAGLLNNDDPLMRKYAAAACGELDQPPEEVLAGLTLLLDDEEPAVRKAAREALAKLGAAPAPQ